MTAVDNRGAGLGYRDPATIVDLPLVPDSAPEAQLVIPDGNLTIKRSILPGGVRLLTQTMAGSESTAIGFWFGVGSRDESPNDAGVSHFLEHLLFKGTGELSALDIARRFDGVGADWNAATTMESTYYWSHMVDTDVPTLLPTLVQMVTDAALRQRDVDIERGVILDELAMAEDSSSDVLFQNYAALLYPDASLGRPVGGTPTTVLSMGRDTIADIYRDRYRPRTLVVAVAGAVNHDQFAEMLLDALEDSPWQLNGDSPAPRRTNDLVTDLSLRDPKGGARNMVIEREVEQAHVVVGGPHLPASDPLAPSVQCFSTFWEAECHHASSKRFGSAAAWHTPLLLTPVLSRVPAVLGSMLLARLNGCKRFRNCCGENSRRWLNTAPPKKKCSV